MVTHDYAQDHRERLERQRLEAAERREQALVDQRSMANSPATRISIWESLHQVRLPKDPRHAVLRHVARQTALDLDQVLEVQRQRAEAVAAPEPAQL